MDKLEKYFKYDNNIVVSGLTSELNIFYILNYFNKIDKDVIVLVNTLFEATKIYNLLSTYTSKALLFPMDDFLTSVVIAESPDLKFTRLESLKSLSTGNHIVVTNLMGYLKHLTCKENTKELKFEVGSKISRKDFIMSLEDYGYIKESIVTSTGEYAVRGLVLDIFLMHYDLPIRIEFDGDIIESIRTFDESSQRTLENKEFFLLNPAMENSSNNYSSLLDYVNCKNVIIFDKNQIDVTYQKLREDVFNYQSKEEDKSNIMFNLEDLNGELQIYIDTINNINNDVMYVSKEIENYNGNFEKLLTDFNNYIKIGKDVTFYLSKDNQIKKIRELIPTARIIKRKINNGFIFENFVVIGENDINQVKANGHSYKKSYKFGKRVKSYDQLEIGDYVVHITHGVGIYNGITTLNNGNISKDFLQILYSGNDKIYVPASKITTIYKYGDKDGTSPKINKLGGDSWKKTRNYIESKIKDISMELISLYKKRLEVKSEKYSKFSEEEIFNNSFEHQLTSNQSKSVNEILSDLTKEYPMDRLLCGDVGFGKTEVAFRGMFNTVLNNKQVMYLCPTTILSSQQFKVALERFKDWPIEIGLLNRFVSKKEQKITIDRFNSGKIDILFGTHRILSDDIKPSKLGLLVVDEEQRFGVTHKEKIKSFKNDINVLTLSATPIPRTLKMALSGLRDLSVIDTPPVNRYPVQTYVINENDLLIKDAIYKELSRKGQVFILYNKVDSIETKMNYIRKLVPEARINFAHGQMDRDTLENIMNDFTNYKYDILVCTTIIESGIDIPNVNTLLVYDADKFGLSQLYQIRGRVGRSNKIGYAYLLYEQGKILTEVATKRLKAIKDFTELGSGYKIAMRDLAIRGAGDVFGASQAGFVDSVGISLYLKMMDDEIKRQRGETVEEEESTQLLEVNTHISDDYVSDEDVKVEIHNLINKVSDRKTFDEIKEELTNRFGAVPDDIIIYMYEEWFEKLASILKIKHFRKQLRTIEFIIPKEFSSMIKGDKLLMSAFQISTSFNIKYQSEQIIINLLLKKGEEHHAILLVKLLETIISENNFDDTKIDV